MEGQSVLRPLVLPPLADPLSCVPLWWCQYYDPELCRPALPVEGDYNEADIEWRIEQGPPDDAMDYLMRVRWVRPLALPTLPPARLVVWFLMDCFA